MRRLGIDRDFLREFGKLERPVQDRVYEAFAEFEQATHTGLHLERIKNVRDDRLRSIRIDQFWRGIVLAPETGTTYTLLKVLPHDDAYHWARRQRVTVNRATGVIEMRDVAAIEEQLPQLDVTPPPTELFGDVKDSELAKLGVDEQVRAFAHTLNALEQLEAARGILPEPQYDVLLGLALGMSPEEVWDEVSTNQPPDAISFDTADVDAAVERSAERVVLVTGPDELMDVFSYPFALWRTYLHPSQRQVAYAAFSGPARVTGGPGTGKTVAALHRVRHLARRTTDDRSVLLTTFTRTLARALDDSFGMLIDDEPLLRRVDVRHIDQVAYEIVSEHHGRLPVLSSAEETQRWSDLRVEHGVDFGETFLAQEWRHVVLAQQVGDLGDYLSVSRSGRGRRLGRVQREQLWPALSCFGAQLTRDCRWTYETICVEAARLLAEADTCRYQHIVVDEAQDFSPLQWRLIRAAVAPGPNDIFIAGDTHQRIYDHRVSLRDVGIAVAGRSSRLTVNYRTTAEILAWSLELLRGESVDDLDGGLDDLAGCRSSVHGPAPVRQGFDQRTTELNDLVTCVRGWLERDVAPTDIGIAARSSRTVEEVVAALKTAGLRPIALAKRAARDGEIPVATMHRLKGLEFRCVALVGVGSDQVPAPSAVTPVEEDPTTHALDVQRERCLLFVACTRAREELRVTWSGQPSPLLPA